MKKHLSCLVLLICSLGAQNADAILGFDSTEKDHSNTLYTTVGLDYSVLTWGVGYARTLPLSSVDRHLTLFADLSLAMLHPDFEDFRVRIGTRIDAYRHKRFVLPFELSFQIIGTENLLLKGVGFGTELGTMPGFYASKWFIAAEIFWMQMWSTHLKHTDSFRKEVYEHVEDGWYLTPAFTMRYGLRLGGIIRGRVEMMLRGGYEQHSKYNKLGPRFYGIFSANVRF